ncbi:MAG: DUF4347 domain-containing protein, partial [Planctomycetales bacterium]|nr:DUF4347 domain-containing protein [Planctomycetales bacterium]
MSGTPLPAAVDLETLALDDAPTPDGSLDGLSPIEHDLVIVDGHLADLASLLSSLQETGLDDGFELVVLDDGLDGIEQLTQILSQHHDLRGLHIVSHGDANGIQLGSTWLDLNTLTQREANILDWRQAFAENADLFLYGCRLAESDAGVELLESLHELLSADIAASTDLTGNSSLGGDWDLEYQLGEIDSHAIDLGDTWQGVLNTYYVTSTNDSGAGSLRQAIIDSNSNLGADTIEFDINGPGIHTIRLQSELEAIVGRLTIDATTESGYAGTPRIVLDGSTAGAGANGLTIEALFDVHIHGLEISGFGGSGVYVKYGFGHMIGIDGTHDGNVIKGNANDGVTVGQYAGTGISVRGNLIYGNGDLAIDLMNDGVTFNDPDDDDSGPNNLQNFPVLSRATIANGSVAISGTLRSQASATYTIDFYSVHSGVTEYLGSTTTTTDDNKNAAFSTTFAADTTLGDTIYATATSSGKSTSEMSAGITATSTTAAFYWSTQGDGNGNGAFGLESWTSGEVVALSDPNLDLTGATHTGTLASLLNLSNMAADGSANIDGMHYVSRDIVIGSGANQLQLRAGDLLLSTTSNETLDSLNSLSVTKDDIFVFRPTIVGNYASGTFIMALDDLSTIHGGTDTIAFTLVEQATTIGDINPVTLNAGSFLLVRDGATFSDNIYSFDPVNVGAGTTTGPAPNLLLNGEDFGLIASITGLDLVESSMTIGGVTLPTASLVLTVDTNLLNLGSNLAAVRDHDIIHIMLQETTQGSGTAKATAVTLAAGADFSMNGSSERFDALSIYFANEGPAISSIADVTIDEDTQSAPITFQISDPDDSAASLTVTATSSNNLLIPSSSFLFQGTDENRTLQFTPAADANGGPVTITVTVSDGKSSTSTSFQVSITPINDAPTTHDDTLSIVENSANGMQVGFVSASDPDLGDSLSYTIIGGTGQAAFSVNSTTGRINVANSSLLDFETTTQY